MGGKTGRERIFELFEELKREAAEAGTFYQPKPKPYLEDVLAEIGAGDRVLLIGGGEETPEFREKAGEVVCVDNYAGSEHVNVVADAENGGLAGLVEEGSFDAAAMFNIAEISYDPVGLAEQANRALKPGGKFYWGEIMGRSSWATG